MLNSDEHTAESSSMPKPDVYLTTINEGSMHCWSSKGDTTSIEQYAKQQRERAEKAEAQCCDIPSICDDYDGSMNERVRKLREDHDKYERWYEDEQKSVQALQYKSDTLEQALAAMTERAKKAEASINACSDHQPTGGTRATCLVCAVQKLSNAISKIDYACGERNEMGMSPYDLHCDETDVVERVKRACTQRDELREQLRVAREGLEKISNNVMWGIQYRYAARDALGDGSQIDDTMEFDKNGDLITDYREQDGTDGHG